MSAMIFIMLEKSAITPFDILTLVITAFIALFADSIRVWLFSPKLKVAFEENEHYIVYTPEMEGDEVYETCYVRFEVINSSKGIAYACKSFLQSIEKIDENGTSLLVADFIPLAVSYQGTQSTDIYGKTSAYFDIFIFNFYKKKIIPQTLPRPFRYVDKIVMGYTYRFNVIITGKQIRPIKKTFLVVTTSDIKLSHVSMDDN